MNEKEVMMLIRRNPEEAFQRYAFMINAERTSLFLCTMQMGSL